MPFRSYLISSVSIPSYFRQSLYSLSAYLLIVVENFPAHESLGAKEGDILIDDRLFVQGYKDIYSPLTYEMYSGIYPGDVLSIQCINK